MIKTRQIVRSTILIAVLCLVALQVVSARRDKREANQQIVAQGNSRFSSSEQRRAPRAVSESNFNQFYANIKSVSFSENKLKMIQTGAIGNKFTCQQTAKLINLFSFDKEKIEAVELLAKAVVDRENYRKIEECFTFNSEKEQVRDILISTKSPSHPSGNRDGRTMAEGDFNLFHANVKSMSSSENKLKMIQAGAMDSKITCSQAASLVKLFSFAKEKIKVIEILAGTIVDRENYRKVEECFTFNSEKEQVRDILISTKSPSHSSGNRGGRAMAEGDFNLFHANVKSTSFSKEKLKMLQTGAIGNKFTCNQAAKLVKLFSFSSEKLEVVEILSRTIVDRENYRKIEECFTFDSDKRKVRTALGLE